MYKKGLKKDRLEVIHSLSLDVNEREIVAVVGSSGSGKSILANTILGLLPKNAETTGNITYKGIALNNKNMKRYIGKEISYIPQSSDYLDPLMKVGRQVIGVNGTIQRQKELFNKFKLDKTTENLHPFELSGGMIRRVFICGAVMGKPKLIIADEPTPGLNIDLAVETLKYLREIADNGAAVILITHDIDLAFNAADRIAVFYAGTIIEIAPVGDFISGKDKLRHPYSKAFIDALPQNDFKPIDGKQPYPGRLPKGCLFYDRCNIRTEKCKNKIEMRDIRNGKVRCIYAV